MQVSLRLPAPISDVFMDVLLGLLSGYDPESAKFRPTEICSEGWLLKAVVHQAEKLEGDDFPSLSLAEQPGFRRGFCRPHSPHATGAILMLNRGPARIV